jgi:UDP-N-acetylenolpyruvoylglucosamine reductase
MIRESDYKWTNWAGNHSCIASNYFEPETIDQISEVVLFAANNQLKIRVVGSGHSFTPIALSNRILISLKKFRKLISVDGSLVTCQSGMYLHELYPVLAGNKLSLSNFGVINKQTVAGALATGTHGSGLRHKSISSAIERLKIMTASGDILEIDENSVLEINDRAYSLYDSASVSLGLLGIVLEVTFKCEPLFYLKSDESVVSFDEYLEVMDEYAQRYEYFKAWWFPHTNKVYLYKTERIAESDLVNWSKFEKYSSAQRALDAQIDAETAPMFIKSNEDSALIPQINQDCLERFFTPRVRVGNSFEILVHDETVPMIVAEYGLPMQDGIHKSALKDMRDTLERSEQKMHFPVDLRYASSEGSWLSPSYDRDTFYIGMCVREYRGKEIPPAMQLFFDVMKRYDTRPNWGKLSNLSRDELEKTYPRLEDFRSVRGFLDTHGMFQNEFLERII